MQLFNKWLHVKCPSTEGTPIFFYTCDVCTSKDNTHLLLHLKEYRVKYRIKPAIERRGQMRYQCGNLIGKHEEKHQMVYLEIPERETLKLIFKNEGLRVLTGFISLGI
jgi:hypothetical protein